VAAASVFQFFQVVVIQVVEREFLPVEILLALTAVVFAVSRFFRIDVTLVVEQVKQQVELQLDWTASVSVVLSWSAVMERLQSGVVCRILVDRTVSQCVEYLKCAFLQSPFE
jgi:hypothetical protein